MHARALLLLLLLCSIFYEHAQSQRRRERGGIRICMHTHRDKSLIGKKAAKINMGNTGFEKGRNLNWIELLDRFYENFLYKEPTGGFRLEFSIRIQTITC